MLELWPQPPDTTRTTSTGVGTHLERIPQSHIPDDITQPKTLRSTSGNDFTLCVKDNFTPDTKTFSQPHPQAASPKVLTNWTQDSYCYFSFDVMDSIIFLELAVCLANDHIILLALAKMYTSIPTCLKGYLVEVTPICSILKNSGDCCFPQEAPASESPHWAPRKRIIPQCFLLLTPLSAFHPSLLPMSQPWT